MAMSRSLMLDKIIEEKNQEKERELKMLEEFAKSKIPNLKLFKHPKGWHYWICSKCGYRNPTGVRHFICDQCGTQNDLTPEEYDRQFNMLAELGVKA